MTKCGWRSIRRAVIGRSATRPQSGVYQVTLGPPIVARRRLPSTSTPAESDLTKLAAEDLPKEFLAHSRTPISTRAIRRRSAIAADCTRGCCYVVLGLLFAETFLAWRFGNASA